MAKTDDSPVIAAEGVSKSFGSKKALDNISLEVKPGEIFGFLGPNGAGKTTTIRILLDILRPDKGKVSLFGLPNKDVQATHKRIGYLSGEMAFEEDLTGAQYLNFVNRVYGGGFDGRLKELTKLLDVKLDFKISSYSRGNKQKIGLISAMMHQPDLLILDEPTSGFDPLVQEKFIELMHYFRSAGGTVFISSHILSEVQVLCDRLAFIKDGEIISVGSVSELAAEATKKIHLTAGPKSISSISRSYRKLPGLALLNSGKNSLMFSYKGQLKKLLKYLADQDISDVTIHEPELEEIFLELYK